MKKIVRLTESDLHRIIKKSVNKMLIEARKPSDRTVGRHTLKGLRYNKNGNPLYTCDTMSDEEKKSQGWRFSKIHGYYGQLSDPTKLHENDFNPNGYKATSAFGGYEMQLDDNGDMARLRDSHTGNVSEWLEIQFDENGVAYVIDDNGNEERLCDYMRY